MTTFKDLYSAAPVKKVKKKVKLTAAQKQAQKEGKTLEPDVLAKTTFDALNKVTLDQLYYSSNPILDYMKKLGHVKKEQESAVPDPKNSVEAYKAELEAQQAEVNKIEGGAQLIQPEKYKAEYYLDKIEKIIKDNGD